MVKKNKASPILERHFASEGSHIIHEGEEGNTAFLIQSGSVVVYTQKEKEGIIELATLGTGEIFGEMALIDNQPRQASVKALEDCNLIVITRDKFEKKLVKTDSTIRAVVEMLTSRMLSANEMIVKGNLTSFEQFELTLAMLYEKIMSQIPVEERSGFEKTIMPKMNELVKTMSEFKDSVKK